VKSLNPYAAAMQLNEAQRKKLGELIHNVLVEIRELIRKGKAQQAAELADAFHNLPNDLWDDDLALEQFCDLYLKDYLTKYPREIYDFEGLIEQVIEMGEDPSTN
jgi:hypothetical protein